MLKELDITEDYPSDFDMEHFKSLSSYKSRLEYINSKLKKLGSGSSRTVYQIDDKKVLKVAKNQKGIAQNQQEYNLGNDYYLKDVVAEVFEADDNMSWIEMEKADKINAAKFKQLAGCDIKDLYFYLINRKNEDHGKSSIYNQSKEIKDQLDNNEFVLAIYELINNYNMGAGDLSRLSSYGVVHRDGKENIIIIDYGLNDDIGKEYYGMKENHNKIRKIIQEEIEKILLTNNQDDNILKESFFNKTEDNFDNLYNAFKSIFLNLKTSVDEPYKMKFLCDNLKQDLIVCKHDIIINYNDNGIQKFINVLKNIQSDIDENLINKLSIDKLVYYLESLNLNKPIDHIFLKLNKIFKLYIDSLDNKISILSNYYLENLSNLAHYFPLKKYKIKNQISFDEFSEQLYYLQIELLKLQEWIIKNNKKVLVIVEGRDAAGKGGTIEAFSQYLNPKYCRIETFDIPNSYQKKHWFKRYEEVLPTEGEIVFFDRSWYNRAVVEPVMGYCSKDQYKDFMHTVNDFEKDLVQNKDIHVIKFWLSVDKPIQRARFEIRKTNPLGYWKYSDNDKKVIDKWDEFTFYINKMLKKTNTKKCPWHIMDSNDNLTYKLECIKKVLFNFDYDDKKLNENKEHKKKENIIFLDINGVLIPQHNFKDLPFKYFNIDSVWNQDAIKYLNELIEKFHAKIVIVSSYRKIKTIPQMQQRFHDVGIKGQIISTISPRCTERALGVRNWLESHQNVNNFVIIDDNNHHYRKFYPAEFVQPKHDIGMDENSFNKSYSILNTK